VATFLFSETIFGPVISRRLGNSLGINLLPVDCKVCNFNCIYCECGWTDSISHYKWEKAETVVKALEEKLGLLVKEDVPLDSITFAGNGEPTMHPGFETIIDHTLALRDKFFPRAKIAVLSNATLLHKPNVFRALMKIDRGILKLDSAIEDTLRLLNKPSAAFSLKKVIENLQKFEGQFILQTMFVKGVSGGQSFDNTQPNEVVAWLKIVKELKPERVMIYTISRDTPTDAIYAIDVPTLQEIARKVEALGIEASVSG
jgi:wyosine [tRNA(Phe)-imidazoG37] synthetase (radical SAM superfamily)